MKSTCLMVMQNMMFFIRPSCEDNLRETRPFFLLYEEVSDIETRFFLHNMKANMSSDSVLYKSLLLIFIHFCFLPFSEMAHR